MAARCATLAEFLTQAPEFGTVGPQSTGTVTIAVQPAPGDAFTLVDSASLLPVSETYVAGTDFVIGATVDDTAANLAAAITAGALAQAAAVANVVTVVSVSTGPVSLLGMTTSNAVAMVLSGPTLTGGDAVVEFALECACAQINVQCWGQKADCAHVYLSAFFLSVSSGTGGGGGAVSSKTIDKISVSYAVATPTGSNAQMASNKWGQLYLQLRKSVFVAPVPGRAFLPIITGGGCW